MKNKYVYIIEYIIILLFTVYMLCSNEIHKQDEVKMSVLTAQNQALQQDINSLQQTVDKQLQNIQQLTEENERLQTKSEAQKSNRSADRPRYNLTDSERDLVERVVMAESGGESYEGQMLVAQCILNACEIDGIRPFKTVKKYVYAKGRPKPTDSVVRAVSAVFDRGEQVTDEPIVYFYAPGVVQSKFHESQRFVMVEGNHRFFCARENG